MISQLRTFYLQINQVLYCLVCWMQEQILHEFISLSNTHPNARLVWSTQQAHEGSMHEADVKWHLIMRPKREKMTSRSASVVTGFRRQTKSTFSGGFASIVGKSPTCTVRTNTTRININTEVSGKPQGVRPDLVPHGTVLFLTNL